jgi:hypothetical protein
MAEASNFDFRNRFSRTVEVINERLRSKANRLVRAVKQRWPFTPIPGLTSTPTVANLEIGRRAFR